MDEKVRELWCSRLDNFCVFTGSLVPMGLIIGNAGFESMIALTGLCWLIRCFIAKENPLGGSKRHSFTMPWLAWMGVVCLSLIWNGPGSKGWAHDIALLRYFIYFTALIDISRRRSIIKPMIAGLGAGVLWGLLNTVLAYSIGHDLFGRPLIRYSGKIKEASRIASLAAYAGPFFGAWALLDKNLGIKSRFFFMMLGLISLVQIFHAGIRTVEISAAAAIAFIAAAFIIKYFSKKTAVIIIVLSILISVPAGIKLVPKTDLSSVYDRINIWKVAWAMVKDHPVLGVSVSAWQDQYKKLDESGKVAALPCPDGRVVRSHEATHAHSLFFQIISCTGILGLCAFSWLLIRGLSLLKKPQGWRLGLITWPVAFFVIGMTGWNIYDSQYQALFVFFMVLTGIGNNFMVENK